MSIMLLSQLIVCKSYNDENFKLFTPNSKYVDVVMCT